MPCQLAITCQSKGNSTLSLRRCLEYVLHQLQLCDLAVSRCGVCEITVTCGVRAPAAGHQCCLLLHSSENTQLMLRSLGRGHRACHYCVQRHSGISAAEPHIPGNVKHLGKKLMLTVLFAKEKTGILGKILGK